MFNGQFCSAFTKEDMENMPDKGQSPHRVTPTINISLNGVIGCVKRLNPRKACGPDKMPKLVLKETSNEIAPILQYIFQNRLTLEKYHLTGKMPTLYLSSRRVIEPNPPITDQLA